MTRDNNDLKRDQYISNKQKRYINWFIPVQKFSQQKLTFVPQQLQMGFKFVNEETTKSGVGKKKLENKRKEKV